MSDQARAELANAKPGLLVKDDPALNAETPPHLLDHDLTPLAAFFVRNNGTLPAPVSADAWELSIDGEVQAPRTFSLAQLRADFETVSVTAVLECAGNGRADLAPATEGVQWEQGAVGCARWTGFRMRDVLDACGVKAGAIYTAHHSPDTKIGGTTPAISRGLPIGAARAPDTLIAFAMNDAPLTHLHGAPLRVVAPGFPGSAWQKWLNRISLRECEHDGEKMTGTDYRLPRRDLKPGDAYSDADFAVITDMPVHALITSHANGACVGTHVEVGGYAWSGHVAVDHVDVSTDGGGTWQRAELAPLRERFAWRRFRSALTLPPGSAVLAARATDVEGNSQPLLPRWNPRGYCNNQIHRIAVTVA